MKKTVLNLTITMLVSVVLTINAQNFFEPTNYVGALSSDPAKDWTAGWTNFDPKTAAYPAPTDLATLDAMSETPAGVKHITSATTLSGTTVYKLAGIIVVDSLASLTIPAGTIIRAQADASNNDFGMIVVHRGAKIFINGTKESPVIMTSAQAVGSREASDWGGLFLAGMAVTNGGTAGNQRMEGFDAILISGFNEGYFGGNVADDNSGSITYLRLEFGGLPLAPNKEINGVTFGAIGNETNFHHVQVSYSGDDSYEWFGGSVNCKYLIAYSGTDDDFDTDNGFSGMVQFGIGERKKEYYDATYAASSGASTSEGFESDNDASGTDATPFTKAIFSNMTMIGPVPVGSTWTDLDAVAKAAFRRGARIRRNSRLSIFNSIFMGYRNFLMLDGSKTMVQAGVSTTTGVANISYNAEMQFKNNLIVNSAAGYVGTATGENGLVEVASGSPLDNLDEWIKNIANTNKINPVAYTAGTVLVDPTNYASPNFRPVATSPALMAADFSWTKLFGNINTIIGTAGIITANPNSISNLSTTSMAITISGSYLPSATVALSIPTSATGFVISTSTGGTFAQSWTFSAWPMTIGGIVVSTYSLPETMVYAQYTETATPAIVTYLTVSSGSTSALVALSNDIAPLVTLPGSVLGINALNSEDSEVTIYPNPTEDGTVTIVASVNAAIIIYDITGTVVYSAKSTENKTIVSGLFSGFYIAKVGSKSQKLIVK